MNQHARESKSTATIRRRTNRSTALLRIFNNQHKTSTLEAENPESESEDEVLETADSLLVGPKALRMLMSSQKTLFLGLLTFRVLIALFIQTAYVPDEYWQSIEVAHRLTFGYGYLTWEWLNGLRGYTYPAIFAFFYKILSIFHLDSRMFVTKGPRLIQSILAALGDLYVYRLTLRLSGIRAARWTLLCQLTSWFTFYTCTRTLTNSTEAVLTTIALYYFPWPYRSRKTQWRYLSMVALSIVVRPTAAVTWFPLCVWHLVVCRQNAVKFLKQGLLRGLSVVLLSLIIDRVFYGSWVNVFYNFLEFNFLSDLGSFYGSHPWHWYLTQGLGVVLATHIFVLVIAAKKGIEPAFLGVISWSVFIYSLLSHKEFRFLSGILPLVMHVCGCTLHQMFDRPDTVTVHGQLGESQSTKNGRNDNPGRKKSVGTQSLRTTVIVILIGVNLPVALYTCLIHQRGTIDVMGFLHKESQRPSDTPMNILYLMPCHSTPYYSYIHNNVTMRFLTCEPNLSRAANYMDEADIFYSDPVAWLDKERYFITNDSFDDSNRHPSHVVMFDELYVRLAAQSRSLHHGYDVCGRFFHTHFPEGRVSANVVVLCSSRWTAAARKRAAEFRNFFADQQRKRS